MKILILIYQVVLLLLLAPLTAGMVKWFKARLQGRKGASPFLPYLTLLTLCKKQMVIPESGSWVFRFAPYMTLGMSLFLVLVLPLIATGLSFGDLSNFFVVAGVLILGTIFLVFGGLESASAFGGMGASREMTTSALIEPTVLLVFGAFAIHSGSTQIDTMIEHVGEHPFLMLSILGLVFIALAEDARYPVDNPATHLELTMVHEAMILEYSGVYLAMMEYASFLKLTIFSLLIANIIWPTGMMTLGAPGTMFVTAFVILLVKIIVAMFLLALLESTIVKMRFYRINEYMTIAFFFALSGIVFTLISTIL